MAIETFRRTITTTATLLYSHPTTTSGSEGDFSNKHAALLNVSATQATVILGPSTVTAGNGARWTIDAGRAMSLEIEPGESIYGIVGSGTQDIDVLVSGR